MTFPVDVRFSNERCLSTYSTVVYAHFGSEINRNRTYTKSFCVMFYTITHPTYRTNNRNLRLNRKLFRRDICSLEALLRDGFSSEVNNSFRSVQYRAVPLDGRNVNIVVNQHTEEEQARHVSCSFGSFERYA